MGVINFFSSSSYDAKYSGDNTNNNLIGNPNPKNFLIRQHKIVNDHLIVVVQYPESLNYEGIKILVYDKFVRLEELIKQGSIDPHFSKNREYLSPIARFVPNDTGLKMAEIFCKNYY